ncbi:MAG TPA: hypothetical protein VGH74_07680 [Planctomycetaceae bacterium]|jgi:hypothetical protein
MNESLQTRWRNRYAIGLTGAGCSLLLDPTGANVAEAFYVAGALDALGLLVQMIDGPGWDLLDAAADIYDEADRRLATLEASREPRLIGGPNE